MKTRILTVALLFSALVHQPSIADDSHLVVKPDKCVALRRGQICYQRVRLEFRSLVQGGYCLLASDQSAPLKCWTGVTQGKHFYQLASDSAIQFTLVDSANKTLAETQVSIAWVYKKSRKRSTWRLF